MNMTDIQKQAVKSLHEALDILADINAKDIAQSTLPEKSSRAGLAKTILQSMRDTLNQHLSE